MRRITTRQGGFTMAELLTTLALTGITASLAVPSLQSVMRESRQADAANAIIASLHSARSGALTRNTIVTICASEQGSTCETTAWERGWIVFVDDNRDGQRQIEEPLIDTAAGAAGVSMRSIDAGGILSFRGNGQLSGLPDNASTVQITICDARGADAARAVIINATGNPRAQSSDEIRSGLSCPDG